MNFVTTGIGLTQKYSQPSVGRPQRTKGEEKKSKVQLTLPEVWPPVLEISYLFPITELHGSCCHDTIAHLRKEPPPTSVS